ncbi:hypothetical protein J6590_018700 [Homalodisca vitripennis]|nr:hypothetical protein J6590_018700 [Homalodisca vitripennis]
MDSLDTTIDYRCSRGGSALVDTKIADHHVWGRVTSDVSSKSGSLDTRYRSEQTVESCHPLLTHVDTMTSTHSLELKYSRQTPMVVHACAVCSQSSEEKPEVLSLTPINRHESTDRGRRPNKDRYAAGWKMASPEVNASHRSTGSFMSLSVAQRSGDQLGLSKGQGKAAEGTAKTWIFFLGSQSS